MFVCVVETAAEAKECYQLSLAEVVSEYQWTAEEVRYWTTLKVKKGTV